MVWNKAARMGEHAVRSASLSLGQAGRQAEKEGRSGSRGGAPIWVMREAWMPSPCSCNGTTEARLRCLRHRGRTFDVLASDDPDGFAIFGRYPKGFLAHVVKSQYLGRNVTREDILHVCSGTLSESERWTVDIRAEACPWVQASGTALPFRDASFMAVMLDPPYSDEYARNLYKTENPRPSWLLKEAARVVRPGGRVGILHVAVPFAPPACRLVNVYGVSVGVGFRIRALTVYEKVQSDLPGFTCEPS